MKCFDMLMYFLATRFKVRISVDIKRLLIRKVLHSEQKDYVQFIISVDGKCTCNIFVVQ